MKVEIINNKAIIKEDGKTISYATFIKKEDNIIDINGVFTSMKYRGKGLAKMVLDGLYDYLKENNIKAIPTCPYAVTYFDRYQEKRDVLVEE